MSLDARLYLVTDAISDAHLHAAIQGGVDLVQLRMKHADDAEILTTAARFKQVCDAYAIPLVINDRPDLAVASGAAGVHLGQDDADVSEARGQLGDRAIIGLSTHTPEQVGAAGGLALSYFAVGPIHATPTKPGRAAVGAELVRYAAAHATLPFFAIGGLDATNTAEVRDAGARRIAVVRAISETADPRAAAADLRAILEASDGTT